MPRQEGCLARVYASPNVVLHQEPRLSRSHASPGAMPRQGPCLANSYASRRVMPRQDARLAAGMPRQHVCLEVVLMEAAMLEATPTAPPALYVGPNFVCGPLPRQQHPTAQAGPKQVRSHMQITP